MFAIDHAATALILKRRFRCAPLVGLLLAVQLVEILWVALNLLGVERTTTEPTVSTVRDIHLADMPYSHSIFSSLVLALLVWIAARLVDRRRSVAIALALGVLSHIALDLVTHVPDLAVVPFLVDREVGFGLYGVPLAAFFVETGYGILCWWIFRGNGALLAAIVGFNLANVTFFSAALQGPEAMMAGHPLWIVAAVGVQIAITLVVVGWLARPRAMALEREAGCSRAADRKGSPRLEIGAGFESPHEGRMGSR